MRRSDKKSKPEGNNVHADERLQEKLVERYFGQMDLDDVHVNPADAGFDSQKVYNNILNVIDAETVAPVKRSYTRWLAAASIIVVFAVTSWYYRYAILNYVSPVNTLEVAAANGNITNITLSDGTKIWLNSGSKLRYPDTFRGKLREITIEGEAFFDVVHDANKPFVVHSGDITTHVLGTSFNVKAYADERVFKVDVVSGKVGIAPSVESGVGFETIFLTPAQGIAYDKEKHAIVKNTGVDLATITAWTTNKLVFKNTPINEVLNILGRKFDQRISADKNLTGCIITADFTNVPLKDIMAVIAKLVKGKATLNNNVYHLKGKGC